MSECFIGEIILWPGTFAPVGWQFCDGSSLPVSGNETLYAVIGNTYGGDSSNFNVPDLRGRVPLHRGPAPGGSVYIVGQTGGATAVTLQASNLPIHNHGLTVTGDAGSSGTPPSGGFLASTGPSGGANFTYIPPSSVTGTATLNNSSILPLTTGGQPHANIQPSIVLNYIICVEGIYPSPG